jgi:hypothetical protein
MLYSPPGISNGPPLTGEQIIWWVICLFHNFLINELVPCFERFCINIGIKILSNVFPFSRSDPDFHQGHINSIIHINCIVLYRDGEHW